MTRPGVLDTTHGVIAGRNPAMFTHRNLIDTAKFEQFLAEHARYVSIADALAGKGDALTLDDSTATAAEAARLARKHGHEVTLFVNGHNIVANEPYFFSRLALALDTATNERVVFEGSEHDVTPGPARARFRKMLKTRIAKLGTEEERQLFVNELAALLGSNIDDLPEHLRPLTRDELVELRDLGVEIHNHGWTHVRIGALDADAHAADIARGREWLRDELGVDAHLFAVPNGDALPLWRSSPHYSMWLLLDDAWPCGEVGPGVINRRTLDF